MTIHDLFRADHTRLRERIQALQTVLQDTPVQLETLFPEFQKEVRAHFRKEDDVYYAVVDAGKRLQDRELMHSLRNDHAAVVFTLESLAIRLRRKAPIAEWTVKWNALREVLLPHFDQEEKELFPEVEKAFNREELAELLTRVQALE
jgi:iron-sulfur cluster repair protein YtfE (RIC family)